MSKIIKLVIESDPDSVEISIDSATAERVEDLAVLYIYPVLTEMATDIAIRRQLDASQGS